MKIVFSRKGWDRSTRGGGGPSPRVNGRPCTLPIPSILRARDGSPHGSDDPGRADGQPEPTGE